MLEKSLNNKDKKSAASALLPANASIIPADAGHKKNVDRKGRLAVECVFVLTLREKRLFMKSVKRLGPSLATQLMYQAVVSAAPADAGHKKNVDRKGRLAVECVFVLTLREKRLFKIGRAG